LPKGRILLAEGDQMPAVGTEVPFDEWREGLIEDFVAGMGVFSGEDRQHSQTSHAAAGSLSVIDVRNVSRRTSCARCWKACPPPT
jgi:hypothetical protein